MRYEVYVLIDPESLEPRYVGMTGDSLAQSNKQRTSPESSRPSQTVADPRQGAIILDGARLGRWIADRLSREASRPMAGTTGIDPRLNPIFPGAPTSV